MNIPNKESFTLNEVSTIAGIRPYIIKFWIKEFDMFPDVLKKDTTFFRGEDISNLLTLKNMMFKENISIDVAKQQLNKKDDNDRTEKNIVEQIPASNNDDISKHYEQLKIVKEKLNSLLEFAQSLKEINNWS